MATTSIRSMTDTWASAGTTFSAIQMNVTDTSSQAGSKVLDLQVDSSAILELIKDGQLILTTADAAGLVVGPNGATNPCIKVDASTGSAATGVAVTGNAAASGVQVAVISSGTNESLDIDAKGSGTIDLAGTSTGAVTYATNLVGTSTSANALTVGANGTTNPGLNVDASTGSAATGIDIVSNAAASGVQLSVLSSGTNESLDIDAKGSGTIDLAGTSTGAVTYATSLVGTSTSANALTVGANGTTNPQLNVQCDAGSVATGLDIVGNAAASGLALTCLSSGTNESMTIDAKGSGSITLSGTSTGGVFMRRGAEVVTAANTLTAAESGGTYFLNAATEFASTLPAPALGLEFDFIISAAPSGANYTITTDSSANIILGFAVAAAGSSEDTETSGCDTINFVGGVSVVGDRVRVVSDGTNWFATAHCAANGGITFTTAT